MGKDMLVNMNDILLPAKEGKYGVGFFNAVNVEMARAIIETAEELKAPVMIECIIPEDDKVFPMVPAGAPISEVFDGDDLKRQS